jgi:hypothetical protein
MPNPTPPKMPTSNARNPRSRRYRNPNKGRANKKNMVKTSRRGAYKPARKKQMVIRRNPIVETFKYQSTPGTNESFRLDRTSAYNQVLNQSFCTAYNQSLDIPNDGLSTVYSAQEVFGPTCRGRDIYSKMTATKLRFDFPEDEWSIKDNYTAPTVIHGWIKKNMFKTSDTDPIPRDVKIGDFNDLINHEMENQFDEANDKLDFRDARPTQYVILGRKQIRPNRNRSIAMPPIVLDVDADKAVGALPPVFHTCKWNVNRKIALQETKSWYTEFADGASPSRFYPADCWIPFIVIFNPSFAKQIEDATNQNGQILVSYNSVHYYTDS